MPTYRLALRFFLFGALLGSIFLFSSRLFQSNFALGHAYLWVLLMVGLPFGAAMYVRLGEYFERALPNYFAITFLWMLLANWMCASVALHWSYNAYDLAHLTSLVLFQSVLGLFAFFPLWLILGGVEFELYKSLREASASTQRICYFCATAGLTIAPLAFLSLQFYDPFFLGLLSVGFFALYFAYVYSAQKRPFVLGATVVAALTLLSGGSYIVNPNNLAKRWPNGKVALDRWTASCRLFILDTGSSFAGYYNTLPQFSSPKPGVSHNPEEAPADEIDKFASETLSSIDLPIAQLLPKDATVAVLGVGLGAQLAPLLAQNPKTIYAVDIFPAIFDAMDKLGINEIHDSRVHPVMMDGRKFIESKEEEFDLIYLPLTDSPFRLAHHLFEPADHLFTKEAFQIYRQRLKPEGLVVIRKLGAIDGTDRVVTSYRETLESVGFHTLGYKMGYQFVVFASPSATALSAIETTAASAPDSLIRPMEPAHGDIFEDDKPFLASFFFRPQAFAAGWIVIGIAVVFSLIFLGRTIQSAAMIKRLRTAAMLTGINYTTLLLATQLVLFFYLPNPLSANITGTFCFLSAVGAGAILVYNQKLLAVITGAFLGFAVLAAVPFRLALVLTLTLWSGGLFPQLLNRFRNDLLYLLILDGIGASIASAMNLIVPSEFGIRMYLVGMVLIFCTTFYTVQRATRKKSKSTAIQAKKPATD